ncbi:hypothetical protein A1Q1_04401 [Trichosporon asahii var. asahii CBS 2479]|uniref:Uncharacterized protein n=1 Tax=Trichosporon asahii var. asahii (strain ATCC 90039 / CBS 2479 / JCM 2466 / KCTC 7840 / NBRC 103889/ NCYC 2677 / UAMH 7654) TaxID=1186058 RepID=J6EQW4_TRIAS|nr:hypothetical protein A1Q1_04401 [Trichosporon asahii var. asahii CBS 2479]EJT46889.1 hypothetical protein A1Q1_04401 [Trichosporon asahii var. asahii CBS 2479]
MGFAYQSGHETTSNRHPPVPIEFDFIGPTTQRQAMPPKTKQPQQAKAKPGEKRKWTPRPERPASERLPKLYRALADQVNDGYFDNAKKTCRKNPPLPPPAHGRLRVGALARALPPVARAQVRARLLSLPSAAGARGSASFGRPGRRAARGASARAARVPPGRVRGGGAAVRRPPGRRVAERGGGYPHERGRDADPDPLHPVRVQGETGHARRDQ